MKLSALFILFTAAAAGATAQLRAVDSSAVIGLPPEISRKLAYHSRLSVAEIATLSRSGFSEAQLRQYIRASRAIYQLNTNDIAELQAAGVSNANIDEMLARKYVPQPVHRYIYRGHPFPRTAYPHYGAGSFGFPSGRGSFHGGRHSRH